jgi:phosphogluconate dehydratase
MSGASGKIPAAIHVVPEARDGGAIAKIISGDIIRLDAEKGVFECLNDLDSRTPRTKSNDKTVGLGREIFSNMRMNVSSSEEGAGFI